MYGFWEPAQVRLRLPRISVAAGAAVAASIGYIDPGNFAANLVAGSHTGYSLLWVLVVANLMAVLMQWLACRLGILSGKSLARNCREQFSKPVWLSLWLVSELMVVATDVAEVIGGAVGLQLLTGWALPLCVIAIGAFSFLLLALSGANNQRFEASALFSVALIGAAYVFELSRAKPDWSSMAYAARMPATHDHLLLAVGMIGATVMPHVIHLQSGMITAAEPGAETSRAERLRSGLINTVVALTVAGLINCAMIVVFADFGHRGLVLDSLSSAYMSLTPVFGWLSAKVFGIALLVSGLGSTMVGIVSGQIIIDGFVRFRIPLVVRRSFSMVPALIILLYGCQPTAALIYSQVALSLALPFTIVPLIWFNCLSKTTDNRKLSRKILAASLAAAAIILAFNSWLVADALSLIA